MRKLTASDLLNLKYGDKVFLRNGSYTTTFSYVGRMSSSNRYLIFSSGENLKHLYISERDDSFKGEWFKGEFDDKFVIKLCIEELEKELEQLHHDLTL